MEIQTVYKQVAIRDGKYWSCFVGVPGHDYGYCKGLSAQEYKIGQVTEAPTRHGIFCKPTEEMAIEDARKRQDMWDDAGLAAVLECYPLGDLLERWRGACNYLGVFVIREIWREEVPCLFKGGDQVQFKAGITAPRHCVPQSAVGKVGVYQGKSIGGNAEVLFEGFAILYCLFDELELAPKEEWVDVTGECVPHLISIAEGCYLELRRCEDWVVEMGLEKPRVHPSYKMEDGGASGTSDTFHYFKILKKVTQ